ncbi:hypothetical protein Tco_0071737 [Tanacetum coccineum]
MRLVHEFKHSVLRVDTAYSEMDTPYEDLKSIRRMGIGQYGVWDLNVGSSSDQYAVFILYPDWYKGKKANKQGRMAANMNSGFDDHLSVDTPFDMDYKNEMGGDIPAAAYTSDIPSFAIRDSRLLVGDLLPRLRVPNTFNINRPIACESTYSRSSKRSKMVVGESSQPYVKDTTLPFQCPILTSTNYTIWKMRMEVLIGIHRVWDVIDLGSDNAKKNNIVKGLLFQSIPEDLIL